jgi:hypothetical protein
MSTVKSIYLQHLNGTTPNATMDTNGNFTVGGTVSGASSNMFRNRIINGDMRIDQRNAGASITGNDNTLPVDRFKIEATQSSKMTAQQNAGSVTPPTGFRNYLGITSSSSYAVLSTDLFSVGQRIEGFNVADLFWGTSNAATVTLSFKVYSSLTGTFGGSITNSAQNRSYPFSYTISSANSWTTISVTIPGDTSGTWLTTNGLGLYVIFGLGCGSNWSGTVNTWASAAYYAPTGATSVVGTSGATFYITGVQLEVGTTATPFEVRSYGHELSLCQRYYEKSFSIGTVPADNINQSALNVTQFLLCSYGGTAAVSQNFSFLVQKRSSPTMTFYNQYAFGSANGTVGQWKSYNGSWQSTSNLAINQTTDKGFITSMNLAAGTTGQTYFSAGEWVASSEL